MGLGVPKSMLWPSSLPLLQQACVLRFGVPCGSPLVGLSQMNGMVCRLERQECLAGHRTVAEADFGNAATRGFCKAPGPFTVVQGTILRSLATEGDMHIAAAKTRLHLLP